MQYRRAKMEGGTYFFTLVTHNRHSILTQPENVDLLREAFSYVMKNHPFSLDAITKWQATPDRNFARSSSLSVDIARKRR